MLLLQWNYNCVFTFCVCSLIRLNSLKTRRVYSIYVYTFNITTGQLVTVFCQTSQFGSCEMEENSSSQTYLGPEAVRVHNISIQN